MSSREPFMSASHLPPLISRDGVSTAWLQCAGAFVLFFNSWGIINTYGVFQTFYQQDLLRDVSASNISWVGSIQSFLLIFGGLATGPLFDSGYLKLLIYTGSFLMVFGMMMTSLCWLYWQVVLAQGMVVGLGCACFFVPSVAIIPLYFEKRKAFGMGVAAAGSSIGGVIYPIIFHQLQPRLGFGWSVRIMAFIMLATLMLPLICMKLPHKSPRIKRAFDTAAWKEGPFTLFALSAFFGFLGLYVPIFYVQIYSIEKAIVNKNFAFYLLPLLNAGSFFGRITPNYFADKAGALNTMTVCTLIASILNFAWIAINGKGGIIVFCFLYGFFSGAFVSLGPAVIANLSPNMAAFGGRLGMLFMPAAAGILIGNPIAGAILRNGWVGLQVFCGCIIAASVLSMFAARVLKTGSKLLVKV